jgi:hypothetical protein
MGCLLSRKACAEYLGVCLRTVRYWDAGRCRVPWSAVRLLRFVRQGDLGALSDRWAGFYLTGGRLFTPDGRGFTADALRLWWSTVEQARLWRDAYDAAHTTVGSLAGMRRRAPATDALEPDAEQGAPLPEAVEVGPSGTASTLTAFPGSAAGAAGAARGKRVSLSRYARERLLASRSGAGLVILSTSDTPPSESRSAPAFQGVLCGR